MSIFPRRDDWRSLLSRLNEPTLLGTSQQYEHMVRMLEQKLETADGRSRTKVLAVLADYRNELNDVRSELARRGAYRENVC